MLEDRTCYVRVTSHRNPDHKNVSKILTAVLMWAVL